MTYLNILMKDNPHQEILVEEQRFWMGAQRLKWPWQRLRLQLPYLVIIHIICIPQRIPQVEWPPILLQIITTILIVELAAEVILKSQVVPLAACTTIPWLRQQWREILSTVWVPALLMVLMEESSKHHWTIIFIFFYYTLFLLKFLQIFMNNPFLYNFSVHWVLL